MKRYMIVVAALALGACNNKPTSFGVDVEAKTNMLSSSVRNSIVTARLIVSGAESFNKDIGNVAKAAQSGSFKFRYVPGVHSGSLVIRVNGVDAGGNTVAGGIAPAVNLVDGKSVDAVLTLAVNGNGVTCMAPTDCISGNCVDGVCCDTACDGVCESCSLPGLVGACSAAMPGTDPDNDCAAKIATQNNVDGGTPTDADGGTSGGITNVNVNPQACAGMCNGMRACAFPDNTISCGDNYCAATASVGSFFCDGNGSCNEKDIMCSDYVCAMGACKTLCNTDADCQSTDFCNLNINKCVPKHVDGTTCALPDECASGFCSSGVCCNTDCTGSGQVCNATGSVGKCQCQSHPCPSGIACQLFYKDGDNDTYGDINGTIANGNAVAGCTGDAPPKVNNVQFVADHTDCNDQDNRQHPGQTNFYTTPSNVKGDYDYNCDGTIEKATGEFPGGSCGFCSGGFIGDPCTKNATCGSAGAQSTLSCGLVFTGKFLCPCCNQANSGFNATVPCGGVGTIINCGTCSAASGGAGFFNSSGTQACQ